jgi:hypothetical protein
MAAAEPEVKDNHIVEAQRGQTRIFDELLASFEGMVFDNRSSVQSQMISNARRTLNEMDHADEVEEAIFRAISQHNIDGNHPLRWLGLTLYFGGVLTVSSASLKEEKVARVINEVHDRLVLKYERLNEQEPNDERLREVKRKLDYAQKECIKYLDPKISLRPRHIEVPDFTLNDQQMSAAFVKAINERLDPPADIDEVIRAISEMDRLIRARPGRVKLETAWLKTMFEKNIASKLENHIENLHTWFDDTPNATRSIEIMDAIYVALGKYDTTFYHEIAFKTVETFIAKLIEQVNAL